MGHILVFGAGSDLANELAKKYALMGHDIYFADKNPETLEEIKQFIIDEYGVDSQVLKFDVAEFYNHRKFYESITPAPLGIICTVDHQGDGTRAEKDFLEAKRIIDYNYTGLVAMFNIIANDFEERESGFMVFINKSCNENDEPFHYIYKSAKDGFAGYVAGLNSRLAKSNVSVITAVTGPVVDNPEKFAEKIFSAQGKGITYVSSKNESVLSTLARGLKWK